MNAIAFKNVHKSFGRKRVLNGISGTIPEGKVVGLLGRNGEGKTTLLRILLDILAADNGSIEVLGKVPNGSGEILQLAGYIPERPAFHDFMTVREVLELRARFFRGWDRLKAEEMARKLELDIKTPIKGASKGTLAKTAWICATAHRPKVLLLDEPTSGLDAVVRDAVLSHIVRELTEEGKTILVTNHHMEELLGILDEIWLMGGGKIVGSYPLEDLRHHAFRVTGRLALAAIPKELTIHEEQRIGELVRWMIIGKESLYLIKQKELLGQMEVEPLPLEATLKALLSKTVDASC